MNRRMIATRLSKLFPSAEILLILRGQKEMIRSLYNQFVKMGWFLGDLDNSFISVPGPSISLDGYENGEDRWRRNHTYIRHRSFMSRDHFLFSPLVEMYAGKFKTVHLFLYEDLRDRPAYVVKKLEGILSREHKCIVPKTSVNESLDTNKLFEKKNINQINSIDYLRYKSFAMYLAKRISTKRAAEKYQARIDKNLKQLSCSEEIARDNRRLMRLTDLEIDTYPDDYHVKIT